MVLRHFPSNTTSAGSTKASLQTAIWLDLCNPSAQEISVVEALIGSPLPSIGDLREIEASSRLRKQADMLFMSTPSSAKRTEQWTIAPPVGFVLSPNRLVTVRFMELPAFDAVGRQFASESAPSNSIDIFMLLCDAIVERVADGLENLAGDLNELSNHAFQVEDGKGNHAAQSNRILRGQLKQVGRLGDRFSQIRDGLQGLNRVVAYTDQYACAWARGNYKPRLESLLHDTRSLLEYEEQLSNKVQFVLDALVGLIGIAQNDLFKVLTIVSIVGIPPTLVAGIYGMNFKNMPEYEWSWGYQYGWAVIILSAIIPLVWFKVRRWF